MKQRYSTYKNSGVEWIGQIPSHWKTSLYKYNITILSGFPFKSELFDNEEGFPLMRIRDITSGTVETFYKGDFDENYVIKKGDIVIGMDGEFNVRQWENIDILLNQRCCKVQDVKGINRRFIYYTLPFDLKIINDLTYYTTVKHLSVDDIKNIHCVIPPIDEQEQIVKYLDEKTSQVDSLISITEKKIEILKQKRTSLINEVVTKGLNKNVELKDSGVEWIGEIPKHWYSFSLRRVLRTLTDFESNGSFSSVKENVEVSDEGDVWYVRMTDLENYNLRNEQCKYCNIETYNFLLKTSLFGGELLITKRGEIGKVYLFPENMGKSTLGPNSYLLRFDDRVISRFLYWFYKSDYGQTTLKLLDNSTTIGSLYKDDIKGSPIILPPLPEQEQIVEYIDTHTTEIDKLVSIEQRRIETLKEYRQSLISEVVSGKIRICEEVTELQEN